MASPNDPVAFALATLRHLARYRRIVDDADLRDRLTMRVDAVDRRAAFDRAVHLRIVRPLAGRADLFRSNAYEG